MNKPIGCTKCGGNGHNTDECKRFAGELWAVHAQGPDDIYPAFDRADAERHAAELNAIQTPPGISVGAVVIPSPMSPLEHWKELAEQEREHKAQVIARAAQPAPVVPEGYVLVPIKPTIEMVEAGYEEGIGKPDRSGHARVIEQYDAMLAAAPAQGQQVEWRTTAVMLEQANAGLAQLNGKLRAELSALKAQQVGQEPAVPECVERIRTLLPRFEAGVNWTGEDAAELAEAAYDAAELLTTKPAPSQDVAGLASSDPVAKAEFETRLRKEFESRWPKPKGVTWGAGINDYCVSEFAEGIALSYPDMWMAYKAGAMRTNQ